MSYTAFISFGSDDDCELLEADSLEELADELREFALGSSSSIDCPEPTETSALDEVIAYIETALEASVTIE